MDRDDAYDVPDLKDLRCLWAVGKFGSLTRAGIELGISESAVSQRLKSLEAHWGSKLYEAPGGRVRITAAGEKTLELAVAIFERVSEFERELAGAHGSGSLTVAADDSVARYLLPRIVDRFRDAHPQFRLRILTLPVNQTLELVRQGEVDMGIVPEGPMPETVAFTPWRAYEAYVIFPRGHPLLRGGPPPFEDLLNDATLMRYPLIVPDRDDPSYARLSEGFARRGLTFNVASEIGSRDLIKHYVALGMGVAVVSGICLTEEDRTRLEAVEIPQAYAATTVHGIVLRKERPLSPPVEEFLTLLKSA